MVVGVFGIELDDGWAFGAPSCRTPARGFGSPLLHRVRRRPSTLTFCRRSYHASHLALRGAAFALVFVMDARHCNGGSHGHRYPYSVASPSSASSCAPRSDDWTGRLGGNGSMGKDINGHLVRKPLRTAISRPPSRAPRRGVGAVRPRIETLHPALFPIPVLVKTEPLTYPVVRRWDLLVPGCWRSETITAWQDALPTRVRSGHPVRHQLDIES